MTKYMLKILRSYQPMAKNRTIRASECSLLWELNRGWLEASHEHVMQLVQQLCIGTFLNILVLRDIGIIPRVRRV